MRWYYRGIEVVGAERIPRAGPLLLVANHPNALVDALVIGIVVPRRVTLTAKATLFEHPLARAIFRLVPIIPLRRASDEAARGAPPDPARNRASFAAILEALKDGGAVLIFPEGKSHSEPQLAPLRSGAARIALEAREERGLRELVILPLGLTFERKAEPRTRVLALVGEPLCVGAWRANADALTAEIDARLRAVTLNFPTGVDADRVMRVARLLSAVMDAPRSLGDPDVPLGDTVAFARRVEAVRRALDGNARSALHERVDTLLRRLDAFEAAVIEHDIPVNDIGMSLGTLPAARFVGREGVLVALGGPLAWWGRLNHWLPLRLAGMFAERPGGSPEEPAMRTIVAGSALVLLAYVVQTALVHALAGPWWALTYLISLPPSATWDFRFRDRARRARQRMRAYLRLRTSPDLAAWLRAEAAWLRAEAAWLGSEAAAIERVVTG